MAHLLSTRQLLATIWLNFYDSLFTEPLSWRPRLDNLEFDMLSATEASSLEDPFEEIEVWEVIKGIDRDKAPSLDGFSMAFFHECWGMIKGDFMTVFAEFHDRGEFVKSINSTFIAFIPKVHGGRSRTSVLLVLWVGFTRSLLRFWLIE